MIRAGRACGCCRLIFSQAQAQTCVPLATDFFSEPVPSGKLSLEVCFEKERRAPAEWQVLLHLTEMTVSVTI